MKLIKAINYVYENKDKKIYLISTCDNYLFVDIGYLTKDRVTVIECGECQREELRLIEKNIEDFMKIYKIEYEWIFV